jgi:hypothetical protein
LTATKTALLATTLLTTAKATALLTTTKTTALLTTAKATALLATTKATALLATAKATALLATANTPLSSQASYASNRNRGAQGTRRRWTRRHGRPESLSWQLRRNH